MCLLIDLSSFINDTSFRLESGKTVSVSGSDLFISSMSFNVFQALLP